VKIEVILRNRTPLMSSAPGQRTISLDGRRNVPNGFPLTAMRTMPIPVEGEDRPFNAPIIPGNSVRNALRRAMLDVVFGQLRGSSTLSIGAYAAAYSGNASGNPEGVPPQFDEITSVRNHVFLGLFGGGPRMMRGKLSVDSLYPIAASTARVIGSGHEDRYIAGPLTQIVWMTRKDPVQQIKSEEQAELVTGGAASITQWAVDAMQASMAANQKRAKAKGKGAEDNADEPDEAASARGLNTMNAHEVTLPGLDWLMRLRLETPTPAQIGLVLMGIQKLNDMTLGGGHGKGYGEVEIQEVSLKIGNDTHQVWNGAEFDDRAQEYIDSLTEALDSIDAKDFESFVRRAKDAASE